MTAFFDLIDPAWLTPAALAIIALAIAVSAFLRGLTGFGFALAAVPLLSFEMAPARAVPIVLLLAFLGGLLDLRAALYASHWPSLRWMQLGALIGTPIGVAGLSLISASAARVMIAGLTVAAVLLLGRGFAFSVMPTARATATTGFLAGLFGGLAAMPGPPVVAFYAAAPLSRVQIRATLLVFFMTVSPLALANAALLGLVKLESLVVTVLSLPLMYAAQGVGQWCFKFGSDATHKRIAVVCLALIALGTAAKGLSELL